MLPVSVAVKLKLALLLLLGSLGVVVMLVSGAAVSMARLNADEAAPVLTAASVAVAVML